jgi:hypothetical protein
MSIFTGLIGGSKLIRNQSLQYRIKYYEEKKKQYQINSSNNSFDEKVIVIV